MRTFVVFPAVLAAALAQNQGPGAREWEVVRPDAVGLSADALAEAERRVNDEVGERDCFVVVKDGKIVQETYRLGRAREDISELYSHTKSLCASLYGTAVQQGWADVSDRIANRDWNTRQCNADAIFQNVLTMTGQSPDLNNPSFLYDQTGLECLDTIQDFIRLNNPDGDLSAVEWKDERWAKVLGLEHSQWGNLGYLNCGFSAQFSCRDAARVGQLHVNNGAWPGHGQLMDEEYVKKGRTFVYPDMQDAWGGPYGYTLWLWAQYEDPDFDPDVTVMAGSGAQCTWMSREHNSVIVSFGQDDEDNCDAVWRNTRLAIVTRGHPMSNTTFERVNPDPAALKARADSRRRVAVEELPALREYLLTTLARFTPAQLVSINRRLVKLGGAPVPVPLIKSED